MKPKTRSTLKIVLITLGCVIVVAIIVIGILFYIGYRATESFNVNDKPGIIALVDEFIADLNQDKLSDAAALADPQYLSLDQIAGSYSQIGLLFKGYVKQDSDFTDYKIESINGVESVSYATIAYFSDNTKGALTATVIKEDGGWKIAGVHITASPSHINGDIVEAGDQVAPALQNAILAAIKADNPIYLSGDLSAIRQEMALSDPANAKLAQSMSDEELAKINADQIRVINSIGPSTDIYRSHDATWTFNKDMTTVLILLPATGTSTNGQIGRAGMQGAYSNGQWYF